MRRKRGVPERERLALRDELFRAFRELSVVLHLSPDYGLKVKAGAALADLSIAYFLAALEEEDRDALIAIARQARGRGVPEGGKEG